MKIVHLNWSLGTGGTETMMVDIANEQSNLGHKVYIVCLNDLIYESIKNKISDKVGFYCLKRKPKSIGLLSIIKMNFLLMRLNPDIIHVHPNGIARLIKLMKYKKIRTIHSTQGDGKDSYLFDRLCFISEGVRQHSLNQGYDGIVVYNGINTDLIKVKDVNNNTKQIIKIVQVGRLEQFKGQHILLKALSKLIENGYENIYVDFIGEGPYEVTLKDISKSLNVQDKVNFLGLKTRDYIYNHLCDYDLFIQPSLSEGFGLTISEAMTAKVPVITSDLEGPMEVINNGKYGLFFKVGDYISLSEKIKQFINSELNYDLNEARQFVIENFSIKKTASKYISIYKDIVNNTI